MVRAKFRCTERKEQASYTEGGKNAEIVRLVAVSDPQNKEWAKWTPSGTIEMQIDNPSALDQFQVGGYYFVDFTRATAVDSPPANGDTK